MDSSRHALHAVVEATYGTTPATPAFKTIRHAGTTLALAKGSMLSDEIRSDRQIYDYRHGNRQTGGEITGELSYGSYDDFLEAVLGGTWAAKAAPYTAGTISAAAADNSINDSANGLPLLDAGDQVTIAGFTGASTTANQTKLVVVSSTTAKMVLSGGTAFINDAAGESVTVTTLTNRLKVGQTRRSFTLMRQFADDISASPKPFHVFPGQEFNTLKLTVGIEKIIAIVFGILGQTASDPSLLAPTGSTYTAFNTKPVMDTFNGTVKEGGSTIAIVTELSLAMENGMTPRFVVGDDKTIKPHIGRTNLTGQLTAYFEDVTLLQKFMSQTESSLAVVVTDGLGNKYRIGIPRLKYTGGQVDTQGGGALTIPLPFQALYDTTTATTLFIDRTDV